MTDARRDRIHENLIAWLYRQRGTYPARCDHQEDWPIADRLAERILADGVLSKRDVHALVKDEISAWVSVLVSMPELRTPAVPGADGGLSVALG
jgi:hypothetical protein